MLTPGCLKGIGKFYKVKPEELSLQKRERVLEMERTNPLTRKAYACHLVFKFYSILHPDKLFREVTPQEFDEIYRSVRRLRIIFRQMKSRCYCPTSQCYRWYGRKGVGICDEWLEDSDNFVIWALKKGYIYYPEKRKGDQLSIDRIDSDEDYCPENCRWIPHRENCARTACRGVRKHGKGFQGIKNRSLREAFPYATGKRGYVDWDIVIQVKYKGDKKALRKFLEEHDYNRNTIYHILRDV